MRRGAEALIFAINCLTLIGFFLTMPRKNKHTEEIQEVAVN